MLFINGCQAVNYESGIIKLTNYNKQIPTLFKIYTDTECFLKRNKIEEGERTKRFQEHYPNSVGAKLVCINDNLLYLLLFLKVKIVLTNLSDGY